MSANQAARQPKDKRPNDKRNWGFRVASRTQVGRGHMVRCLSLAKAMPQPVTFFLDPGPAWCDELTDLGIPWRQEQDHQGADSLEQAMIDGEIDAALVDGYDILPAAIAALANQGVSAIIDDFGQSHGAQLLINPSLSASSTDPAILCGSSVALLGALYAEEHERLSHLTAPSSPQQPCHVLVSLGAYDGKNCTQLVLQALAQISTPDIEVCAVLSPQAPHLEAVQQFAAEQDIRVEVGPENLLTLYQWADLAIGAAGVSQLERMCCGVPTALILLAENQRANCEAAQQLGCAKFLGPRADLNIDDLAGLLSPLLIDADLRHHMRSAGLAAIDGQGSARVAAYLQDLP